MNKQDEVIDSLNEIHETFYSGLKVHNNILKQLDKLNRILLNLKIEDAKIKENTGILPIANELSKVIHSLHEDIDMIINKETTETAKQLKIIENYINNSIK